MTATNTLDIHSAHHNTHKSMYTILNKQTAIINCDNLQTAIRYVQSLESGLDRVTQHSPYTIVKTSTLNQMANA